MQAVKDRASPTEQVDTFLDKIERAHQLVMARPPSTQSSLHLAGLADTGAGWWKSLSEYCRVRVYRCAALTVREHAQLSAQTWRHHAAHQRAAELPPPKTPKGVAS